MAKHAKLPVTYVKARAALAECARVDECQRWADKAEALRAYAKQMKDGKLEADAVRIRDRAIRRGGDLLKLVKKAQGGDQKSKGRPGAHSVGRNGAAKAAGLSPHQAKIMVRVANVPEEKFEQLVESANPPSAKTLAEIGKAKNERPVAPEPYRNEWIDWTSAVRELASLPACGLDVLAKRNSALVPKLIVDAEAARLNIETWLEDLRRVK